MRGMLTALTFDDLFGDAIQHNETIVFPPAVRILYVFARNDEYRCVQVG